MKSALMKLLCLIAMLTLALPAMAQETAAPAKKKSRKAKANAAQTAPAKKTARKAEDPASKNAKAWLPFPKPGGWMARHEGFVASAKKGGVDVLFMGDSITDGWNKQQPLWEKYYVPMKAINFGIGGDRTENIIYRLQNGELDGITPKVMMLLIGTNNTSKGDSAQDIAKGIKTIIEIVQKKSPATKVLLLGVYPRGKDPKDPTTVKYRANIKEVNEIIAKYDDGKNVKYLYFGDKFLAADGSIPVEMMKDALHLTTAGYQIWVDSVNPVLAEMLK